MKKILPYESIIKEDEFLRVGAIKIKGTFNKSGKK